MSHPKMKCTKSGPGKLPNTNLLRLSSSTIFSIFPFLSPMATIGPRWIEDTEPRALMMGHLSADEIKFLSDIPCSHFNVTNLLKTPVGHVPVMLQHPWKAVVAIDDTSSSYLHDLNSPVSFSLYFCSLVVYSSRKIIGEHTTEFQSTGLLHTDTIRKYYFKATCTLPSCLVDFICSYI